MRERLVAGNWKMNGSNAANQELVSGIIAGVPPGGGFRLLLCPPYPYLATVCAQVQGSAVKVGAQNVSEHESGAFTGEVSSRMLADIGCEYAIVGHSERRAMYDESSFKVAAKFQAAQAAGITPILCVGETLEEREAGATESVIEFQLSAVLDAAGINAFTSAVVAYEPVWAIGTGKTASPEQAQEVHKRIRAQLGHKDANIADRVQILYGGSMKGENAAGLLAMPDIDGGLIGGASLKANDFLAIAEVAAQD
ncbi:MAG: triose-phosphate isomerase [Gammaproteobacteria bacterium]|nr:triose-phosphate isomerase [Gammaproteobacteria bacterium]